MANTDQDNPYNLLNLIRIQTVCFNCIFWPKSGFYAFLDQLNKNDEHVMVTRAIMLRHKEKCFEYKFLLSSYYWGAMFAQSST